MGIVDHAFKQGDTVRIVKKNSTVLNDLAVVEDPNWNVGLVKVKMLEGNSEGKTKSYKPSDMVLVRAAHAEQLHPAAGLKPIEISLTGELEEVGSQRQLLADDSFLQADCGGAATESSESSGSAAWFW